MKVKTDFVTNSSSTSFIVFFPKVINTIEDLAEFVTREDFRKIIFDDIQNQTPIESSSKKFIRKISEVIRSGYIPDCDTWGYDKIFCREHGITVKELKENPQWQNQMYNEQEMSRTELSVKMASNLRSTHKETYAYIFEYGDEDGGIFAKLEHDFKWGGLPFKAISHH